MRAEQLLRQAVDRILRAPFGELGLVHVRLVVGLEVAALSEIRSESFPTDIVVAQEPPAQSAGSRVALLVNRPLRGIGFFRTAYYVPVVTSFAGNDGDQKDNYFRQTKALFTPAKAGNYVFFLASDDHGELYLSTDADPASGTTS